MANCLFECLKEARLERYYSSFVANGVTDCGRLSELLALDYQKYGVSMMEDRLRLHRLVSIVNSVQKEGIYCTHGKKPAADKKPKVLIQPQESLIAPSLLHVPVYVTAEAEYVDGKLQALEESSDMECGPFKRPVIKKSASRVALRPSSDSPVFDCKKTLTFSDSEDEEKVEGSKIINTNPPVKEKFTAPSVHVQSNVFAADLHASKSGTEILTLPTSSNKISSSASSTVSAGNSRQQLLLPAPGVASLDSCEQEVRVDPNVPSKTKGLEEVRVTCVNHTNPVMKAPVQVYFLDCGNGMKKPRTESSSEFNRKCLSDRATHHENSAPVVDKVIDNINGYNYGVFNSNDR